MNFLILFSFSNSKLFLFVCFYHFLNDLNYKFFIFWLEEFNDLFERELFIVL